MIDSTDITQLNIFCWNLCECYITGRSMSYEREFWDSLGIPLKTQWGTLIRPPFTVYILEIKLFIERAFCNNASCQGLNDQSKFDYIRFICRFLKHFCWFKLSCKRLGLIPGRNRETEKFDYIYTFYSVLVSGHP